MLAVKFVGKLFLYFSVLSRLLRAVSWWHRLFSLLGNRVYCRRGEEEVSVPTGPITVSEYTQSLSTVIHVAQKECFPGVLEALETGNCFQINVGKHGARAKGALNPLQKCCSFLHKNVMRIGGRLQKTDFSFDVKHPIVLPNDTISPC